MTSHPFDDLLRHQPPGPSTRGSFLWAAHTSLGPQRERPPVKQNQRAHQLTGALGTEAFQLPDPG